MSMKVRGPLLTLAAVAVVGVGILLVNVSQEPDAAPSGKPAAPATTSSVASAAPQPPGPTTPPAPSFPAKADYVGKVPIANGVITLEITVEGDKAIAYACDGNTIESWLRGPAVNGTVSLANKDKTSRLEGRLEGAAVVGTLWIGEKKWDFTAAPVQSPAGLYVYEEGGERSSWIVDSSGEVTGVLRRVDGSTAPAPVLEANGNAVLNGRPVTAVRVEGGSDV
jgi:hypothetical protein